MVSEFSNVNEKITHPLEILVWQADTVLYSDLIGDTTFLA